MSYSSVPAPPSTYSVYSSVCWVSDYHSLSPLINSHFEFELKPLDGEGEKSSIAITEEEILKISIYLFSFILRVK